MYDIINIVSCNTCGPEAGDMLPLFVSMRPEICSSCLVLYDDTNIRLYYAHQKLILKDIK